MSDEQNQHIKLAEAQQRIAELEQAYKLLEQSSGSLCKACGWNGCRGGECEFCGYHAAQKRIAELESIIASDESRLQAASLEVFGDATIHGCDTPEWLADEVLWLRAHLRLVNGIGHALFRSVSSGLRMDGK